MNIGMSESSNKTAWLQDIDKDTFARFCRFAYTGDYAEAAPDILLDEHTIGQESAEESPPPPEPEGEPDQGDSFWSPAAVPEPEPESIQDPSTGIRYGYDGIYKKKGKKSKKSKNANKKVSFLEGTVASPPSPPSPPFPPSPPSPPSPPKLWESFVHRKYDYAVPQLFSPSRANAEACEDYTPVFLCHTSLYVFGDRYDIKPLRDLALFKLHDCLCKFTIYPQRVADVVELVRYVYEFTVSTHDALRSLVIQYVAANVEHLFETPEFDELLKDGGEHTKDLVCLMVQRLKV